MPRKKRKRLATTVLREVWGATEPVGPTITTQDRVQLRNAAGLTLFATRNRENKQVTFSLGMTDAALPHLVVTDASAVLFCEKLVSLTKKRGTK